MSAGPPRLVLQGTRRQSAGPCPDAGVENVGRVAAKQEIGRDCYAAGGRGAAPAAHAKADGAARMLGKAGILDTGTLGLINRNRVTGGQTGQR